MSHSSSSTHNAYAEDEHPQKKAQKHRATDISGKNNIEIKQESEQCKNNTKIMTHTEKSPFYNPSSSYVFDDIMKEHFAYFMQTGKIAEEVFEKTTKDCNNIFNYSDFPKNCLEAIKKIESMHGFSQVTALALIN